MRASIAVSAAARSTWSSSDDGINASTGGGGAAPGAPDEVGDSQLVITGGYVTIDAGGDGIDSIGPIQMSDGVVIVNGPTTDREGAIDYGIEGFALTGGYLLAVGSPGHGPGARRHSTEYSVIFALPNAEAGGTRYASRRRMARRS